MEGKTALLGDATVLSLLAPWLRFTDALALESVSRELRKCCSAADGIWSALFHRDFGESAFAATATAALPTDANARSWKSDYKAAFMNDLNSIVAPLSTVAAIAEKAFPVERDGFAPETGRRGGRADDEEEDDDGEPVEENIGKPVMRYRSTVDGHFVFARCETVRILDCFAEKVFFDRMSVVGKPLDVTELSGVGDSVVARAYGPTAWRRVPDEQVRVKMLRSLRDGNYSLSCLNNRTDAPEGKEIESWPPFEYTFPMLQEQFSKANGGEVDGSPVKKKKQKRELSDFLPTDPSDPNTVLFGQIDRMIGSWERLLHATGGEVWFCSHIGVGLDGLYRDEAYALIGGGTIVFLWIGMDRFYG